MTEKRYGFEMDKNCYKCIADTIDKKLYTDKKQIVELLNAQHERIHELEKENITIKNTIKEAMENERTHLGYNTLKQLAENLKVKIK